VLAEGFSAQTAPHLYPRPVEWAANLHLAASIPNLSMVETIGTGGAFHQALIEQSIAWEHGFIIPPDAPGLGISFNEDLARAHPYRGAGLHLEMQEPACDWRNGNAFPGARAVRGLVDRTRVSVSRQVQHFSCKPLKRRDNFMYRAENK